MISAGSGFAPAAGGMTTYYEGLTGALPAVEAVDETIAFVPPGIEHAQIEPGPALRVVSCDGLGESRAGRVAYEHFRFPRLVAAEGVDVLLSTHNVKPLRWRGPSVVVLQSMQYFFLPDKIGAARRAYLRATVPRSLRAADRVIAVTEAARADAIELFGLDPGTIVAVHHGCSPWATEGAARFDLDGIPPPPPPLDPARPYILNVSSLYGLKNHRRLIEAFALAVAENDVPQLLVIAGRDADQTAEELGAVAERAGVGDRVCLLGPYPQQHLPALVANADAIAYPSLYETFGHPVLEAFAFGRPLLTANLGGASEVAADAAIKVDPESVEAIASGLADLLTDSALRDRLGKAGAQRLLDFSWERSAEETAVVLREAIAEH
jgi:glycosyltransferase involved in cell wall biosynthesis